MISSLQGNDFSIYLIDYGWIVTSTIIYDVKEGKKDIIENLKFEWIVKLEEFEK